MSEAMGQEAALRGRDAEARRDAQTRFDRPVVLQAGAGTGKTTALVARIVSWCLGPGWERAAQVRRESASRGTGGDDSAAIAARVASRVAAITFTEAAAAEMASRVATTLGTIASGAPLGPGIDEAHLPAAPQRRARAAALVGAVDRMVVRTIHSFCHRLLSQHPVEAGLHPRFQVDADGRAAAAVVQRVVQEALRAGAPGARSLVDEGPAEVAGMLETLVREGVSSDELAASAFTPERVGEQVGGLARRVAVAAELLAPLADAKRSKYGADAVVAVSETRARLSEADASRADELVAAVRDCWMRADLEQGRKRGALLGHLQKKWAKKGFADGESAALGDRVHEARSVIADVSAALDQILGWNPREYARLLDLLVPLLVRVEQAAARDGIIGFDGLLRRAHRLLVDDPSVARTVRRGMDLLLVDEFQDTDHVQCEIVRALALAGPAMERPSLFLVGDPQQSIFGWRNADLAAYHGMLAELKREHGVEPGILCVNHRTVQPILDEVARIARPLLVERTGVQAAFQPLLASRPAAGFARDRFACTEHWLSVKVDEKAATPVSTKSDEASELEADAIAREIRELHDAGDVAYRDVALLFRSLTSAEIYLDALRARGVPFDVARDRSYYQRREVIDAAALVRCVIDPNDALALVTWLRSIAGGVPDAAWLPLWRRGLPEQVAALGEPDAERLARLASICREAAAELRPGEIPGIERVRDWPEVTSTALETLARLRASFASDPADVFVERMRRLAGHERLEALRFLGRHRVASLERFHRELIELLSAGSDVASVARWLREGVSGERDAERGTPGAPAVDAVRVLTMHSAKGLEFGHVYCVQLHRGSSPRPAEQVVVRRRGARTSFALHGAPSPDHAELVALDEERGEAEQRRLLYVATTRARDRLVLAGCPPGRTARASDGPMSALLSSREGGVLGSDELDELVAARPLQERILAHGTTWALVVRSPAPAAGTTSVEPEALRAVADVEREARALAAHRAAAVTRSARRMLATASSASHEASEESRQGDEPRADAPETSWSIERRAVASERARAIGSAVHRALEQVDLGAEPATLCAQASPIIDATLAALDADDDESRERARALIAAFAEKGGLRDRLLERAVAIVARELPVLMAPGNDPSDAVGAVIGTIDLLYRDRESGELVVADWKTDRVSRDELAERADAYRAQAGTYVQALRRAGLGDVAPRFELYFLHAREIVTVALASEGRW